MAMSDTSDKTVKMTVINFNEKRFSQTEIGRPEESKAFMGSKSVTWINVDGVHDQAVVESFGKLFGIHPLLLEDIMDTEQRPKLEDFDSHLFLVVKMLTCNENKRIDSEQVIFIVGKNYVITFQEKVGDVFDQVRARIQTGKGRIRKMGADFLAYALVDAVVDHCFVLLENYGEEFELIEEELLTDPTSITSAKLHALKRDLITMRRSVWPLRDVYDHTVQVIDSIETYRDVLSGMFDIFLSSISYRTNAVMKVLTIIATIFIPLTFIVGLYGMNFKFMPELDWRWGYAAVWGLIITSSVFMIVLFKRKKWL
jgi:magnesium transporter